MTTPHHYRDLLTRQSEHFTDEERAALDACLVVARDLASEMTTTPATWRLHVEALNLKLLTLLDPAPPTWVRVLVAKAALEMPERSAVAQSCLQIVAMIHLRAAGADAA